MASAVSGRGTFFSLSVFSLCKKKKKVMDVAPGTSSNDTLKVKKNVKKSLTAAGFEPGTF